MWIPRFAMYCAMEDGSWSYKTNFEIVPTQQKFTTSITDVSPSFNRLGQGLGLLTLWIQHMKIIIRKHSWPSKYELHTSTFSGFTYDNKARTVMQYSHTLRSRKSSCMRCWRSKLILLKSGFVNWVMEAYRLLTSWLYPC